VNDRSREQFDLNELLHPERAFGHPSEVIKDPDLTINEKRAILASWAWRGAMTVSASIVASLGHCLAASMLTAGRAFCPAHFR
jgi:hypothetical protein